MSEGMEGSAPAEATAAEGVSQVTSAPSEGAQSVADAVSANNGEMTASDAAAVQEMIDLGQMGDRLVEVTVDGETLRMPLSEVVANTQRAKASHKRFLEAAEARKIAEQKERDIEALVRELKGSNPEEILRELGVDTQGIARREHKRLMDWESMTPEERFRAEMQRERDQLELEKGQWEKQKQTAAEKRRAAQLEAQSRHYQEKYTRDFTAALSNVGVSAESKAYPQMLQFMAQVASEALDAGIEMTPSDIAEVVKEEYSGMVKGFLGSLEAEQLHGFLGDDIGKKFRKYDIDRVKAKDPVRSSGPRTPRRKKAAAKKTYNVDEMRELLRQRRMGG